MISPLLKPAPRARKAPKPIARGKRPARVRQTKRGREKESLNRLWSRVVMAKGRITTSIPALCMVPSLVGFRCSIAATDAAHWLPKSTHPSIRHRADNGVPACRWCHTFIDSHRHTRELLARHVMGDEAYEALIEASRLPSPDRAEVRKTLTAALRGTK